MLADALVVETPRGERFWDAASKNAITAACLLLAAHAPDEWKNLGALADILGSGTGPTLSAFLAAGLCSDIAGGMARRECENLAGLAPQTLSSVTATLATHLRPLSSPLVKASLANSSFSLDEFTDGEPLTLYLVIPAANLRSHRVLIRAWINTLFCAIARRRERPKSRTLFLIDELPALGPLDALRLGSFTLRSYGCDMVLCAQAVDQLSRLYPEDWQALLDNAGAILSFSGGAALRRLVQITAGEEEARALPDLPPGQAALIRDGGVGFIRKVDYRNDPAFRHLAQLNRFFQNEEIGHVL